MDMDPMGQMAMPGAPAGAAPGFMSKLGGKMSGGAPPQPQTTQGMMPVMDGSARGADVGFQPQATQNLANLAPPRENVGGPGMGNMGTPAGIQGGAMGMNQMDPQKKMLMAQLLSKIGSPGR